MKRIKVEYVKGNMVGQVVPLPEGLAKVFLKTGKVKKYKEPKEKEFKKEMETKELKTSAQTKRKRK